VISVACSLIVTLGAAACERVEPPPKEAQWQAERPAPPKPELSFRDPELPIEERARDLVGRLTLEEKIAQLGYDAPAVDRLDVPAYNWWNEALHGVARNGEATVFPQAIALAATFDTDLVLEVATAISDEARAKFAVAQKAGNHGRYEGLTFWSPNINIFRDPRWGRGQETYGEDPYLTGRIGVAFVRGLQGDHPTYLKTAACAKHYAVHSGPEGLRHEFDAVPPKKDFYETYLPAFRDLVQEGRVEAVMSAYNRTYGEPCSGSELLLEDILREKWGFRGHVVSDCWALVDMHEHHKVTKTAAESAAKALKAGVNVNCGVVYKDALGEAVEQGLVTEKEIDEALVVLLQTRFRLGLFDPPGLNPYERIDESVIASEKHRRLARKAAARSIVLLKNRGNVLPLRKDAREYFVAGPYALDGNVLLANYHGVSAQLVTLLEGIVGHVALGTKVSYKHAFLADRESANPLDWSTGTAERADATIVTLGISGLIEGEEGESISSLHKGDREDIRVPENQLEYMRKLRAAGDKPIVVVLFGGSALAIPEVHELADAVLMAWYPGQEGGNAIADVIFGDASPSGRLPITFPRSVEQLPPYEDYAMAGRTYRYMEQSPLYPFGFGLTYGAFEYGEPKLSKSTVQPGEGLTVEVEVRNKGEHAAAEIVQLYLTDEEASVKVPRASLKAFRRAEIGAGKTALVELALAPEDMQIVDDDGNLRYEAGRFVVTVGGASPGDRSLELGAPTPVTATFELTMPPT